MYCKPKSLEIQEHCQWYSQNAEKVTHIKRTLLDQEVILFNCVPFQNGNFSLRKELAPRGSQFFPLREVPYGIERHCYHIRLLPLNVTILLRMCVTAKYELRQ